MSRARFARKSLVSINWSARHCIPGLMVHAVARSGFLGDHIQISINLSTNYMELQSKIARAPI